MLEKIKYSICIFSLCALSSILHLNVNALEGIDFDFDKPDEWKTIVPECGGRKQSPINVNEQDAEASTLTPLDIKGMYSTPSKMSLKRMENDVELLVEYDANPWNVTGGPLNGQYVMGRGYFHWGPINGEGSEHAINGKTGTMSLNFVAYKAEYGDFETALKKPDGLAAFGKMIDVDDDESKLNPGLKSLLPYCTELKNSKNSVDMDPYPVGQFMTSRDKQENEITFLSYEGSMLEPPCRENVQWFVNVHKIYAPQELVDCFRGIKRKSTRPLQPLNDRKIYKIQGTIS